MRHIFLLALVLTISGIAKAETIKFKEEELARESVLPVFDQPEAVKRKLVPFSGRVELEAYVGATLNDPFFNTYPLGGGVSYHLNEFHALGIVGAYHITQQSQYVAQIQTLPGGSTIPFNASPVLQYFAFGEYEFTPYYGKISLTKQGVMNMTISGTLGAGFVGLTSAAGSDSGFGFSGGLNQRLFFTRNFGIKADLKAFFYQQNDIVQVTPSKKLFTNLMVTLGVVYLLPSL